MQAVKQKLHIKPRLQLPDALLPKLTGRDPEADKAKLLMGDTLSVSSDTHFWLSVVLLDLFVAALCILYTVGHKKRATLFWAPTPVFLLSWWTLFVPMNQDEYCCLEE